MEMYKKKKKMETKRKIPPMIDFTYAVFSFWSLRNAAVTAAELSHLCRPKTTSGIVRKRICGPPCINGQKTTTKFCVQHKTETGKGAD